ncbi:MAG: hypothetical protein BGO54_02675 [Sphingobacteriales bacterium 46-32]|nr:MAG: hypothetical protein BGO54_02675 [Sphingobacteriales bacterium 46-32]
MRQQQVKPMFTCTYLFIKYRNMEFHRNRPTTRRPEGGRVLDAPFVLIDTHSVEDILNAEREREKRDKFGYTVFKSADLAIVLIQLQKGGRICPGETNGTLVFQPLKGKIEISIQEQKLWLEPNQLLTVTPNLFCEVVALQDSEFYLFNAMSWK